MAPTPQTAMRKGGCDISILLAGQTGVGKSTLVNMFAGGTKGSMQAARVSNDVRPCAFEATEYIIPLQVDGKTLQCSLWDTRGLDEAVDHPTIMETAAKWFRQQGFWPSSKPQSERDLENICRERVHDLDDGEQSRHGSIVILIWCIHASKIDVPMHWQRFRKVYAEYCNRRVRPVIAITQMTPGFAENWEARCKRQLAALDLEVGLGSTEAFLFTVRKFKDISSPEYTADSLILKDLILRVST